MSLEEPLFVEQSGEAVEQPHILRRDPTLRVDPHPVIEHTVRVVDRRVTVQTLGDGKPASGNEIGHGERVVASTAGIVYVALADVAVERVHPLEDLLRPLSIDGCPDRSEACALLLDQPPKGAVGERYGHLVGELVQDHIRLAHMHKRVAHRQEAAAARRPHGLSGIGVTVLAALGEAAAGCHALDGQRSDRPGCTHLVSACEPTDEHRRHVRSRCDRVLDLVERSRRVLAGEMQDAVEAAWVLEAGNVVDETVNGDPGRLLGDVLRELRRLNQPPRLRCVAEYVSQARSRLGSHG
mmetsp:Transcript_50936/g.101285  ORF Transcript_50936/g.101285 Transcript_50936/m.101285 type:complete len:296 (-) Transcript_50936:25-912(-)